MYCIFMKFSDAGKHRLSVLMNWKRKTRSVSFSHYYYRTLSTSIQTMVQKKFQSKSIHVDFGYFCIKKAKNHRELLCEIHSRCLKILNCSFLKTPKLTFLVFPFHPLGPNCFRELWRAWVEELRRYMKKYEELRREWDFTSQGGVRRTKKGYGALLYSIDGASPCPVSLSPISTNSSQLIDYSKKQT